jgi:hypothetical protein
MHPAMNRIPTPAARQLSGLYAPIFSANNDGKRKMLTPMIEFTIKAVKLLRPIVRTSPCELCLTPGHSSFPYMFPLCGIHQFVAAAGAAFILEISASTSVFPLVASRCGYFSPPWYSTR